MTAEELTALRLHHPPATRVRVEFRRRDWYVRYNVALGVTDAVAIAGAVIAAYVWRFGDNLHVIVQDSTVTYAAVAGFIGVVWWSVLDARDSRARGVVGSGLEEYRRVINSSFYTFGAVAIASYLLNASVSRAFFLVLMPFGTCLVLLGRWVGRKILHRRRAIGGAYTPTVVVGAARDVRDAVRDLRRNRHAGYRPVAVALSQSEDNAAIMASPELADLPVIDLASVDRHVAENRVGAVVVAQGLPQSRVRQLAWELENSPVRLMFVPSLTDVAGPRLTVHQLQDLSLVSVDLPRYSGWSHALKRVFDIVFASAALLVLSPILGVIALLIKREDGCPVIFRQERIGLGGNTFMIHKFRTMHGDAEARLTELLTECEPGSPLFRLDGDPRVTKIGRILRRYSLDELPQFWTALRGAMSIVGPRPHLARELAAYPAEGLRRLLIKPGITGLWQVNGRHNIPFEDAVRLDLRYVENWSLTGDFTIILRTIRVVLSSSGAL